MITYDTWYVGTWLPPPHRRMGDFTTVRETIFYFVRSKASDEPYVLAADSRSDHGNE